jgi:enoyl-CoA hydratase
MMAEDMVTHMTDDPTRSIAIERDGAVARVTVARPPVNALDAALCDELADAFDALAGDAAVGAVVLAGAGDAFSAGLDLRALPQLDAAGQNELLRALNRVFSTIYAAPLPVVAAVAGHAIAGGLVLALCADVRIAAPRGRHGLTEVAVGVRYPVGALEVVAAELGPAAARRLVLGAGLHDAAALHALGAYDELADDPLARATAVAAELAGFPRIAYGASKRALRAAPIARIETALREGDPLAGRWLAPELHAAIRARLRRP